MVSKSDRVKRRTFGVKENRHELKISAFIFTIKNQLDDRKQSDHRKPYGTRF